MMKIQDVGVECMGRRNKGYIFVEQRRRGPGVGCLVLLVLLIVLLMGSYGIGYNAGDFIYNQF